MKERRRDEDQMLLKEVREARRISLIVAFLVDTDSKPRYRMMEDESNYRFRLI
jgi:hypothetical protein